MNNAASRSLSLCLLVALAPGTAACGRLRYARVDGGATEVGESDGGSDAGVAVVPVSISDLRVAWATPHGIRWRWTRTGDAADFVQYELVMGPTALDVTTRSARARVVSQEENPELGVYTLPQTGGMDPVVTTLVDGLTPSTHYFAQLVVTHADRSTTATLVAEADTAAMTTTSLELFDDAAAIGYSIPETFVLSTDRPMVSRTCYRFVSACAERPSPCWEHLRRQGLNVTVPMPSAAFDAAYLEISVASSASVPAYYSAFRLQVGDAANSNTYQIEGITIRSDDAYRTYEIPLSALPGMTWDESQRGLREVGVGGNWSEGAIVRVDEARLRW